MWVGNIGIGGALHVARTAVDMLSVSVVNELQANCHCSRVKWFCCKSCVRSAIWLECCSKNIVWKASSFSLGMGLSMRGGGSEGVIGSLAMSVLGGIWRCMGKWSELRWVVWFVVEMYWWLLGVLMKKPSIKLFWV